MIPLRALLAEIRASTLANRPSSIIAGVIMTITTASVIATAGCAAGRQEQILSTVDDMGTRSLSVHATDTQSPLSIDLLNAIEAYDLVDEAVGFSDAFDVSTRTDSGANRVSARRVYGTWASQRLAQLDTIYPHLLDRAIASVGVFNRLGLSPSGGAVNASGDGPEFQIVSEEQLPEFLHDHAPIVLIPTLAEPSTPVSSILIVADSAADLPFVEQLVLDPLTGIPPSMFTVSSSQQFAALRTALDGSLTASNRILILSTLAVSAVLVMIIVWITVLMRRKDFGRRRALGAPRSVSLILTIGQVALVSVLGALVGTLTGLGLLWSRSSPLPGASFVAASSAALVLVSCALAVLPAIWASARDPLHELRVP